MSGIVIPLADVSPGVRAPRIRVEADETGRVAAEFGQRLGEIGEAMESDRLDREAGRAQVEITRSLNKARLDFEAVADPDALDRGWAETTAGLREQLLGGADRRNADRLGMAFDELADRHAFSLGQRALDLRMGEYRINVQNSAQAMLEASAGVDPETRATLLDQHADQVARAVAAGAMTPEEANTALIAQRSEAAQAAALRRLGEDPAGVIAGLDAGEYAGLDPIYAEGLRARAQSDVASAEAAAAADAERQAKIRFDAIGAELGEIAAISGAGPQAAAQVALLNDPEAQAHPKYAEALAAVELQGEMPRLAIATLPELDAAIAAETATPVVRKHQTERLKVLTDLRDKAATGWGADPIGYAREVGIGVPALPEFDPADPEAFAGALRQRAALGAALQDQGYGEVALPLDLDEQAALREAAAAEADPAGRAALAAAIGAGLGPRAAAEIAADRVFGHMAGALAGGGSPALAREVFRGQAAMAAENVALPPVKDRLAPVFDQVETLFADLPDGERLQADVAASADALYAARMRRVDPAADIDETVYGQALHEVLGGTGTAGKPGAKGGVQEVGGVLTIMPSGVDATTVEVALERIGTSRSSEMDWSVDDDPAKLQRQFAAMSPAGAVPEIDGQPVTRRDLDRMTLRAAPGGDYVLVYNGQVLAAADGSEYRLSMAALLREAVRL